MKAEHTNLNGLLNGLKQYIVPLFQRPYSWRRKEWDLLWEDLLELYEKFDSHQNHFFGPIITKCLDSRPESFPKYLIIDGQQRLITICLLLAALRDRAKSKNMDNLIQELETYILLNKTRQAPDFYKLLPTENDKKAFFAILTNEDTSGLPSSQIIHAYSYFKNKIEQQKSLVLENFSQLVLNKLVMISMTLDDPDNPYRIFESVNYKGLPLTQGDLIRNYFLMRAAAENPDQIYKSLWKPMEDEVSFYDKENEQGQTLTEFLRNFLMQDKEFVKKNEVYSTLKEEADELNDKDLSLYLQRITKSAKNYIKIINPEKEPNNGIRELLEKHRILDVTPSHCFLLKIFEENGKGNINDNQVVEILYVLENFFVRRSVAAMRSSQYNKIFPGLFKKLDQTDLIKSLIQHLVTKKLYPTDNVFKEKFVSEQMYFPGRDNSRVNLLLSSIEKSYGHKEQINLSNDFIQIEHVAPQSLPPHWQEYLGEESEEIKESYLHTIGNLTLTGYNPELGKKSFLEKKKEYEKSNLTLNKYFSAIERWDIQSIKNRASHLVEQAAKVWHSLRKDHLEEIESSSVIGTRPNQMIVSGQIYPVQTWKQVLLKSVELLLELSPEKFPLLVESQPTRISKMKGTHRSPGELSNGYFIETSLNADAIWRITQQVKDLLEFEDPEWNIEYER